MYGTDKTLACAEKLSTSIVLADADMMYGNEKKLACAEKLSTSIDRADADMMFGNDMKLACAEKLLTPIDAPVVANAASKLAKAETEHVVASHVQVYDSKATFGVKRKSSFNSFARSGSSEPHLAQLSSTKVGYPDSR